ncbi:MAG: hypothetical protein BWY63_01583 [Chloroflexi bacterium ADurb.Bin360]|nr:MAG: hypothetical protein BWY63_01583 [Chloroflexi bacterium ADurb.Bin360]
MKKAKLNFSVDCGVLVTFVLSAISGIVFLAPLEWMDLESSAGPAFLGVSLSFWNNLHTYASLAMMGGVALHLILHWTWMVAMAKTMTKTITERRIENLRLRKPQAEVGNDNG